MEWHVLVSMAMLIRPGMDYSNDAPAEKVEYKWSTSALSQLQCEQT